MGERPQTRREYVNGAQKKNTERKSASVQDVSDQWCAGDMCLCERECERKGGVLTRACASACACVCDCGVDKI